MIITKNNCSNKITLEYLHSGEFFEYKGELYLVISTSLTYYTCFNFSKDKCYQVDVNNEIILVDKNKIEITYSL